MTVLRYSILAFMTCLLISCTSMDEYMSPEPIALPPPTADYYSQYLSENSPGEFFVTADGYGAYYTYCPDLGGACRGAGFGVAAGIRKCEESSGRKCYLYARNGQVLERSE